MQKYLTKKNYLILALVFCLAGLLVALDNIFNTHYLNTTGMNRSYYAKALTYQDKGAYKKAYYTYNSVSKLYSAFDAVLFNQAQCAAGIGDEKTAIAKYKLILTMYPNSRLVPLASYKLAQTYLRAKNFTKAEKQFEKITEKYDETDYEAAAYYYLGEIYKKKNLKQAGSLWIKYLELSPNGRFSTECLNELKNPAIRLSTDAKFNIGIALYNHRQYAEALNYLRSVPLVKSWYYIAKSYQNMGQKSLASKAAIAGISKYSRSTDENNLHNAILAYAQMNTSPRIKVWTDLTNLIVKTHAAGGDFAMYKRAQYLKKKDAITVYNRIVNDYPDSKYAAEATWQALWANYQAGNYRKAISLGRIHLAEKNSPSMTPKILFWTAKAYEQTGRRHVARKYYKKLIADYPDDYYTFRANGRLLSMSGQEDIGWKTDTTNQLKTDIKAEQPYSDWEMNDRYSETVNELLKIGDFKLVQDLDLKDKFLDSWMSYQNGNKSHSVLMAREAMSALKELPDTNDSRWRLLYPVYYADTINKYSQSNGLDPFITISLMREESYFNKYAVSCSNARGLMQLMPGTALYIAHYKHLTYSSLNDPESNIKLGTAYLSYTAGELNDKMLFAVGAYNGGPGAVQKWIRTLKYKDFDEFVEKIPYEQTRTYIKKVYKSYWNYRRLYS